MKSLVPALLLAFLAACTSKSADLAYAPTVAVTAQVVPAIASVAVIDAREEKDPNYIGAIRGGYGNPLKTLTSALPVKDEVSAAFTSALRARGLYGSGAPLTLAVTLKQLSGNWYARREGHTIFFADLAQQRRQIGVRGR